MSGTASAATITAYKLTNKPVTESGTANVAPMPGNSPTGNISVVTARHEAKPSERSPGRLSRSPCAGMRSAANVTNSNILGGRVYSSGILPPMAHDPRQAAQMRWLGAAQLIEVVRSEPGITRAAAAQRLGIGSGAATELVARLRRARLLDETPAPVQGRGRPTTVLGQHADGPLVLAADLRAGDWRLALAGIDGLPQVVGQDEYAGEELDVVLTQPAKAISAIYRRNSKRIRAIAISVAGHGQRLPRWASSPLEVGLTSTCRC